MSGSENDPYVEAGRELGRRVPSAGLIREQRRVIELMRRRARTSSLVELYSRTQELERENERLRGGPHGGAA